MPRLSEGSMAESSEEMARVSLLLVEDRDPDAELVRAFLEEDQSTHYTVCRAKTVADAEAQLSQRRMDVLLVDLNLPDAEGTTIVERLIALANEAPLVVLTGGSTSSGTSAIQAGADDFLRKDELNPALLRRAIGYAISRSHRRAIAALNTELESMTRMAASVAHEINNPVAIISGGVEMIGMRCELLRHQLTLFPDTPPAIRDLAENLLNEVDDVVRRNLSCVDRIKTVVASLDAFARPDSRSLATLQIGEVLEHARHLAEHQTRWQSTVALQIEPLPPLVGVREKLLRVFLNLLSNAAQARPEEASAPTAVTVRARALDQMIVVDVIDNGTGIDAAAMPHIFDAFFTTRSDESAAGLGLSTARELVEQHGGTIEADSIVGHGTTVRVKLPIDNGLEPFAPPAVDAASAQAEEHAPPAEATRRRRVLLIDDEPLLRSVTTQLLEIDFDVETASDGDEALERLRHDAAFDVVICDLMMPNLDGPALFDALGKFAPMLRERMVFMTGGAFTERAQTFLKTQPVAVLQKPFRRDDLLAAIHQQLATAGLLAPGAANSDAE